MAGTRLLLIRHGESTWNAEGRWQGQSDPPLSERGRIQSRVLALALAEDCIAHVVSSDLIRARETATILAERFALEVEIEPGLRELDVGTWSGLGHEEIGRRHGEDLARFRAGDDAVRPGGGESRSEVRSRARQALAALGDRHSDSLVAVVTHGGLIWALAPGMRLANAGFWRTDVRSLL
jgi:broad specificity phosphatase PhoE